jgi:hypothetical protein
MRKPETVEVKVPIFPTHRKNVHAHMSVCCFLLKNEVVLLENSVSLIKFTSAIYLKTAEEFKCGRGL